MVKFNVGNTWNRVKKRSKKLKKDAGQGRGIMDIGKRMSKIAKVSNDGWFGDIKKRSKKSWTQTTQTNENNVFNKQFVNFKKNNSTFAKGVDKTFRADGTIDKSFKPGGSINDAFKTNGHIDSWFKGGFSAMGIGGKPKGGGGGGGDFWDTLTGGGGKSKNSGFDTGDGFDMGDGDFGDMMGGDGIFGDLGGGLLGNIQGVLGDIGMMLASVLVIMLVIFIAYKFGGAMFSKGGRGAKFVGVTSENMSNSIPNE